MAEDAAQIDVTQFPIVDAHHHFWDLTHNYLSVALRQRNDPISLRRLFGDTQELSSAGLSPGQRQISRHQDRPYGSRMGSPRSGRRKRAGSKPSTRNSGCPMPASAMPSRTVQTLRKSSPAMPRARSCAASVTSQRPRSNQATQRVALLDQWMTRAGAPVMRCWSASVFPMICKRPGGTSTRRPPSPPIFRARRSSSITPVCRPTERTKAYAPGARRLNTWPGNPMSPSRYPGSDALTCLGL